MRSRLVFSLLLVAVALVPLVRADAASLLVSSQPLTTHTAASQVEATNCTVPADADTYIAEAAPTTNDGTATELLVRTETLADRRSLVRFDLSSCSIPSGASVRTAVLNLTINTAPTEGRTYLVHRATATWSESTVNWDTRPTVETSPTASAATGTTAGVVQWDVKSDVTAFVAGTASNHGWQVKDQTEDSLVAVQTGFAAREHVTTASRPALTITYYR